MDGETDETMDLHGLIKVAGEWEVAAVIGVTIGSLRNKRSGQRPLSIDDLWRLATFYGPRFDVPGTVERIGQRRASRIGPGDAIEGAFLDGLPIPGSVAARR